MRRLPCSLEFLRLTKLHGEALLSSPWKVPYLQGHLQISLLADWNPCQPALVYLLPSCCPTALTVLCCSGMAGEWDSMFGHMEEETSRCHLHSTAPSGPLQAAAGQELGWKEFALF